MLILSESFPDDELKIESQNLNLSIVMLRLMFNLWLIKKDIKAYILNPTI